MMPSALALQIYFAYHSVFTSEKQFAPEIFSKVVSMITLVNSALFIVLSGLKVLSE